MNKELEVEHHRAYTYHFFFNDGLFQEIIHLQDFINFADEFLNEKVILKAEQEKSIENITPEFKAENQLGNIFPDILWRTTFLHSYFLLESSLDQICENIQEAENHNLSLKDISGRGIQRSSTYIRKVCNIIIPFETVYWLELQDFNKVRNIFVHSDGLVEQSNKEILNIAKKYQGLIITDFDKYGFSNLKISKEFTIRALQSIESFFHSLYQAMRAA